LVTHHDPRRVNGHDGVKSLGRHLAERLVLQDAGVVDEDVDA
jgi:hypothetical protein